MNPWDAFTWFCAFALGGSAIWIFGFFCRDARSILDREMHGDDGDAVETGTSPDGPA